MIPFAGGTDGLGEPGGAGIWNEPSPQTAKTELGKTRNPFSSSPGTSPSKHTIDPSSVRRANEWGLGKENTVDDKSLAIATQPE
jgi:hypothetical protein